VSARGSALLQVLVMTAVAGLICASILSARLQPALAGANAVGRVADDLAQQAAINRVTEVWARAGRCASDASAGVDCGASVGSCRCTCAVAGGVTVTSVANGEACAIAASR
jgi:hypothetical protein